MTTICVSIVSYFSDARELAITVESLCANAAQFDGSIRLVITDNTDDAIDTPRLAGLIARWTNDGFLSTLNAIELRQTERNLGYGQANNQALSSRKEDLYLVLNPDLKLESDAISLASEYMADNSGCVLLTPRALSSDGQDLFLNRATPSILALIGRSVRPLSRLKPLRDAMDRYEMRDLAVDKSHCQTSCASGCFMLVRREAFNSCNGFNKAFFMYFEDYDLSIRLSKLGSIDYQPSVRLTHYGGGTAHKGTTHNLMFAKSAFRFFQRHGWRIH